MGEFVTSNSLDSAAPVVTTFLPEPQPALVSHSFTPRFIPQAHTSCHQNVLDLTEDEQTRLALAESLRTSKPEPAKNEASEQPIDLDSSDDEVMEVDAGQEATNHAAGGPAPSADVSQSEQVPDSSSKGKGKERPPANDGEYIEVPPRGDY